MSDKTPLYARIVGELRQKIRNNEYRPNDQLPTEKELASQYDVSLITSKRALVELEKEGLIYRKRGSGSYVKPVAKTPAAAIDSSASPMIGMIFPSDKSESRLLEYINGASDYLNARNCYVAVHSTNRNLEQERALLHSLPERGFSGIIYYPLDDIHHFDILNALHLNEYPLVTIDSYIGSIPLCHVTSDNLRGGYEAASHLIALGHERIAFVCGTSIESKGSVRDRYFGHCRALKDHGLAIDTKLSLFQNQGSSNRTSENDTAEIVKKLMDLGVTAIQTGNDSTAIRIVKTGLRLGLRIPGELSVVGFGDIELSKYLEVPLTTVAQNFYEIGRRAGEILYKKLTNPGLVEQAAVPVKLIARESSGAR